MKKLQMLILYEPSQERLLLIVMDSQCLQAHKQHHYGLKDHKYLGSVFEDMCFCHCLYLVTGQVTRSPHQSVGICISLEKCI